MICLMYAMGFVKTNIDWLDSSLAKLDQASYLIFDCPGQVELYTADDNMKQIIEHLGKQDIRLTCVNLVDAHHCSDAGKFVSVCLTSLSAMMIWWKSMESCSSTLIITQMFLIWNI